MEPELMERAFELFAQGEQGLARSAGGLGIGLTLARSLARLHGGTLEGRSEGPGKGSEFILRIPIVEPDASTGSEEASSRRVPAPGETSAGSSSPARILLVDDNLDAARSTELVLRQAGHDILLAHDGTAAIDVALQSRPDLAILDVGLPRIDGYGVARELRQQTNIPLVALTGYPPEKTSNLLFDAYLVKPVQPEALFQTIAALRSAAE